VNDKNTYDRAMSAKATLSPQTAKPTHRVAVLAYPNLCTFEFGCAVEVFALPRPELQLPWYQFGVCAEAPGTLQAAGGITVNVKHSLRLLDRAHTIVIPGWTGLHVAPSPALLHKLRAAHARGARLASICSGAFVLAAAGLLDGKRATTHWRYVDELARRYPHITVQPNALYVDEGQVVTSAGSAAGLDMMLHLVRRDHGAQVANRVAQRLVVPPHRLGDQAQYVQRPVPADEAGRLAQLLDWLRAHLAQPHSVASLARRVAMSPRTLQRQFSAAIGHAPLAWLLRERVAAAKDQLEGSPHAPKALAQVAQRCGFGSEESLRRHFVRVVGVSPAVYRKQFAPGVACPRSG
jgi:AraC family transcriptional regulator, transcriptional activator FtrA